MARIPQYILRCDKEYEHTEIRTTMDSMPCWWCDGTLTFDRPYKWTTPAPTGIWA